MAAATPDEIFANPLLAAMYDIIDADRSDLDVYVGIVQELGAQSVIDVGCGTGSLACLLAALGTSVVGVDPALASLNVARTKAAGTDVLWIHGDASALPSMQADLAVMTGNVAQVFTTDEGWEETLNALAAAVRVGGHIVFETRVPEARAWEGWNPHSSRRRVEVSGFGTVETWVELRDVSLPLVSFRRFYRFVNPDRDMTSDSTLRFRTRQDVEMSLASTGWLVRDVRDAPDRPGKEHVFIAERAG